MNPKLKELQDQVATLTKQLEAPGADIEAISKSISTAQTQFKMIAEAEKASQDIAKTMQTITADNTPATQNIHVAFQPEHNPNREVTKTTTDLGNETHRFAIEASVLRGFFGADRDHPFQLRNVTEKGLNVMGNRIRSEKSIALPGYFSDLIAGQTPDGAPVSKQTIRGMDDTLREVSKAVTSADTTGYSTDSGAGNLRPNGFIPELQELPVTFADLVPKCTRFPAAGGNCIIPMNDYSAGRFAGVKAGTMATEITQPTATTPYFTTRTLHTQPHGAFAQVSNYAIKRSGVDIIGVLTNSLRNAARYRMSKEIMAGTGESNLMAAGVVGYSGVTTPVRVTANQVVRADLIKVIGTMPKRLRDGAEFLIADAVDLYLQGIVKGTADATPLYTESVQTSLVSRLSGYPWESQ
ncbi:MAG TPA: phage major capsid protein, partial [Candidatus Sumerlaeota bacterium]|nr:phage major capsid protein [Candidatus Sumerlaeota bacterium]